MTDSGGLHLEEETAPGLVASWQARFEAAAAASAAGAPPAPSDASAATTALATGLAAHDTALRACATAVAAKASMQGTAAQAGIQTIVSTDASNVQQVTLPPTPAG